MTGMLLRRSETLQLSHTQKILDNKVKTKKAAFIIFLNIGKYAKFEVTNFNRFVNDHCSNIDKHRIFEVIGSIPTGSVSSCTQKSRSYSKIWSSKSSHSCERKKQRTTIVVGSLTMRYYRMWIYACNIVLLVSALGFVIAVAQTFFLSNDPRRYLVPGVPKAHDPTALYIYLALTLQLGLVQLLGFVAAKHLSARLLNAYWLLLLALLFGDIFIGVACVFRFEKICADFRPVLRLRLQVEYKKASLFSEQWDELQRDYFCCGVTGPLDFGSQWPYSCCPRINLSTSQKNDKSLSMIEALVEDSQINETLSTMISFEPCPNPHTLGCEVQLMHWLKKTADLLFVLGFCVIAFIKLCFLGILRYEIREMIQKIRLLKEPPATNTPFIQSLCPHPQQQASQENQFSNLSVNNGNITRRTTLPIVSTSVTNGTMLRFVQEEDFNSSKLPLIGNSLHDATIDSDTNSHCALILEESTPPPQNHFQPAQHHHQDGKVFGNNANNILEMREFNKRLLYQNVKPLPKTLTTTTANNVTIPFKQT